MKKKYVVYYFIPYIDKYGHWQFNKYMDSEYNTLEEATERSHEIIKDGFDVKIEEE